MSSIINIVVFIKIYIAAIDLSIINSQPLVLECSFICHRRREYFLYLNHIQVSKAYNLRWQICAI